MKDRLDWNNYHHHIKINVFHCLSHLYWNLFEFGSYHKDIYFYKIWSCCALRLVGTYSIIYIDFFFLLYMTPTHMMFPYLGPLGSDYWHGIYFPPPAFPTPAHLTDFDSALQPTLSRSLVPHTFLSTFQIFTRSLYETQTCISSSVVSVPHLMHWEPRPQAIEHSSFPVYTCLYIRILYSGNYSLDL